MEARQSRIFREFFAHIYKIPNRIEHPIVKNFDILKKMAVNMDTFHNNDFTRGTIQWLNIAKCLIEVLCYEEVSDDIWAMLFGSYGFFNRKYDTKINSRQIRKTIPSMLRVLDWIKVDPNEQKRINSFLIATLRDREDLNSEAILGQIFVEFDSEVTPYGAPDTNNNAESETRQVLVEDINEEESETENEQSDFEEQEQVLRKNQTDSFVFISGDNEGVVEDSAHSESNKQSPDDDHEFPISGDPRTDDLLVRLSYQSRPNLGPYLGSVFRCLNDDELAAIKCNLEDFVNGLSSKQASDYKKAVMQLILNMTLLHKSSLSKRFCWKEILCLNKND